MVISSRFQKKKEKESSKKKQKIIDEARVSKFNLHIRILLADLMVLGMIQWSHISKLQKRL